MSKAINPYERDECGLCDMAVEREKTAQWERLVTKDTEEIGRLEAERDALAAHVEEVQRLADSDRVDDEFYDEDGDLRTGDGWKSKLGRDLHSALRKAPKTSLAQRDARVAAEATRQWAQDRKDLIRELRSMQNMTHGLARTGGCSSDYPNGAKAVLERVTGGHAPFFEDHRADEIAAGGES